MVSNFVRWSHDSQSNGNDDIMVATMRTLVNCVDGVTMKTGVGTPMHFITKLNELITKMRIIPLSQCIYWIYLMNFPFLLFSISFQIDWITNGLCFGFDAPITTATNRKEFNRFNWFGAGIMWRFVIVRRSTAESCKR